MIEELVRVDRGWRGVGRKRVERGVGSVGWEEGKECVMEA